MHLQRSCGSLEATFERFTDRSRRVLVLAQEEARLFNHTFIGTEHILLGLLAEGESVAARALAELEVTLDAALQRVEETIGRSGTAPTGSPPFTPRAKKVLELSLRNALQLGHEDIRPEHILLGLVAEGEGVVVHQRVAREAASACRRTIEHRGSAVRPERHGGKGDRRARVRRPVISGAFVAVFFALLAGCSNSPNGTVSGTVSFVGDVPPKVHSTLTKVVAWQGDHQAGEGSLSRSGVYRLSVAPGRYDLTVENTSPSTSFDATVVVLARATARKNFYLVFHAPGSTSLLGVPSGTGPCKADNLTATANHQGAGYVGNSRIGVFLSNTSARACFLSGHPVLSLIRIDGSTLLPMFKDQRFPPQLRSVLLLPNAGNAADLGANWFNWCGSSPGLLRLRVAMTGDAGTVTVAFTDVFAPVCIDPNSGSSLSLTYAYDWVIATTSSSTSKSQPPTASTTLITRTGATEGSLAQDTGGTGNSILVPKGWVEHNTIPDGSSV